MLTREQMQELESEVKGIIEEGITGDQLRSLIDKATHLTQLRTDANRLRGFASEVSQFAVDLRLTGDERELFSDFSRAVQEMYSDRMSQASEVEYEVFTYPYYLNRAAEEDTTG